MPVGTRYRLFYGEMEVGEVTEEDADFPNLFGRFVPTGSGSGAAWDRLQEYVRNSVAADLLGDESAEAQSDFVVEYESRFLDLIESDDWYLLDEGGRTFPVLLPTFLREGGMVWRWNFDAGGEWEFQDAALYVLRKNAELYRRLATPPGRRDDDGKQ